MKGDLLEAGYAEVKPAEIFTLQNSKLLRVALDGTILARQGAMVAYQGEIDFDHQGSGGIGRFIKKAVTGEGLPLMRCTGRGDLFLADNGDEIHLLRLDGDSLTVNGRNILAFEDTLQWDVKRVEGAGMLSGGMFNTSLTGSGWLAITPMALRSCSTPMPPRSPTCSPPSPGAPI